MTDLQEMGEVPPGAKIIHEPYGFVRLVECRANDLMVVNAARVSFRKQSEWDDDDPGLPDGERQLKETDKKVLQFLLKNRHGTPFEHTFFQFHVRAPIFLFREWHRHRIGVSVNEESARYVQLRSDFYLPDDEHVRVQVGKPGHYRFEPADVTTARRTRAEIREACEHAYDVYASLMADGVAKELARSVLPVGVYSQMVWTCNARSLMNFLSLRNHEKTLRELRDYAAAMEEIFAEKMPVTAAAFVENGRVAP